MARHRAPVEPIPPSPQPQGCVACLRTGIPLHYVVLEGYGQQTVCVDPRQCRRYWPKERVA